MNLESNPAERLSNLELKSELGSITLPKATTEALFTSDGVEMGFRTQTGKEFRIIINPTELRKVLLSVNGQTMFKAFQGRLFILAKINNIHVPFYQSLHGTSGKNANEWYPYFGIGDDGWLVKGAVTGSGEMRYHPAVTSVQDKINRNLILPKGATFSHAGLFGTNRGGPNFEPQNVLCDLNEHLGFKSWFTDDTYRSEPESGERNMLVDHTGYDPHGVEFKNKTSVKWVEDIISRID